MSTTIDYKPCMFIMLTKGKWYIYTHVVGMSGGYHLLVMSDKSLIRRNGSIYTMLTKHYFTKWWFFTCFIKSPKNILFSGITAAKEMVVMRWKYLHGLNIQHWLSSFYKAVSLELSRGRIRNMKAEVTDAIAIVMEKVKSQFQPQGKVYS